MNIIKGCTPLRMLFYRDIKIGDEFKFNEFDKTDPFKRTPHKVRVIDKKGKYIKYEWLDSSVEDESMDRATFLFCYIPL